MMRSFPAEDGMLHDVILFGSEYSFRATLLSLVPGIIRLGIDLEHVLEHEYESRDH